MHQGRLNRWLVSKAHTQGRIYGSLLVSKMFAKMKMAF